MIIQKDMLEKGINALKAANIDCSTCISVDEIDFDNSKFGETFAKGDLKLPEISDSVAEKTLWFTLSSLYIITTGAHFSQAFLYQLEKIIALSKNAKFVSMLKFWLCKMGITSGEDDLTDYLVILGMRAREDSCITAGEKQILVDLNRGLKEPVCRRFMSWALKVYKTRADMMIALDKEKHARYPDENPIYTLGYNNICYALNGERYPCWGWQPNGEGIDKAIRSKDEDTLNILTQMIESSWVLSYIATLDEHASSFATIPACPVDYIRILYYRLQCIAYQVRRDSLGNTSFGLEYYDSEKTGTEIFSLQTIAPVVLEMFLSSDIDDGYTALASAILVHLATLDNYGNVVKYLPGRNVILCNPITGTMVRYLYLDSAEQAIRGICPNISRSYPAITFYEDLRSLYIEKTDDEYTLQLERVTFDNRFKENFSPGVSVKMYQSTVPDNPKPSVEEPSVISANKPKAEEPSVEEPKVEEPSVEEPKPDVEEAEPSIEEPKPSVEEPKPSVEEPKPSVEEPKPSVEEPKPAKSKTKKSDKEKPMIIFDSDTPTKEASPVEKAENKADTSKYSSRGTTSTPSEDFFDIFGGGAEVNRGTTSSSKTSGLFGGTEDDVQIAAPESEESLPEFDRLCTAFSDSLNALQKIASVLDCFDEESGEEPEESDVESNEEHEESNEETEELDEDLDEPEEFDEELEESDEEPEEFNEDSDEDSEEFNEESEEFDEELEESDEESEEPEEELEESEESDEESEEELEEFDNSDEEPEELDEESEEFDNSNEEPEEFDNSNEESDFFDENLDIADAILKYISDNKNSRPSYFTLDVYLHLLSLVVTPDELVAFKEWFIKNDFELKPGSFRHTTWDGGLLDHSIFTLEHLLEDKDVLDAYSLKTVIKVALLHDLCKIDEFNKTPDGSWEPNKGYYPLGHGEKSMYLACCFTKLTPDEALAIRWHVPPAEFNKYYDVAQSHRLLICLRAADKKAAILDGNAELKSDWSDFL